MMPGGHMGPMVRQSIGGLGGFGGFGGGVYPTNNVKNWNGRRKRSPGNYNNHGTHTGDYTDQGTSYDFGGYPSGGRGMMPGGNRGMMPGGSGGMMPGGHMGPMVRQP